LPPNNFVAAPRYDVTNCYSSLDVGRFFSDKHRSRRA
jgi:hypothetical protein